jgi:hypothetical protein
MIKQLTLLLMALPLMLAAQQELKIKQGAFDYMAQGRLYRYEGEFVISKLSGKKEKLPQGLGILGLPTGLSAEAMAKKGYSPIPYSYQGTWQAGKKHGMGEEEIWEMQDAQYAMSILYSGGYADDLYEGIGMLKTNDYTYIGDFVGGRREGQGQLSWSNGDVYKGEWRFDLYHGRGIFTFAKKGEIFEGTFAQGQYTQGKYTYASGDVYDGQFKQGLRTGRGTYRYAGSGEVYEGQWLKGVRSGQGKLSKPNGEVYDGQWLKGIQSGPGKLTYANGDVVEGQWDNGVQTGKGRLTYANGDILEGVWQNGVQTGSGVLTSRKSGTVTAGNFVNGKIDGQGQQNFPDGSFFRGTVKNGLWTGEASEIKFRTMFVGSEGPVMVSGRYSGQVLNSQPHGQGTFWSEENSTYNLFYYNDELGEISGPSYLYEGSWQHGKKTGRGKIELFERPEDEEEPFYSGVHIEFEGQLKDDLYDGDRCTYLEYDEEETKTQYTGSYRAGKYHGYGKLEISNSNYDSDMDFYQFSYEGYFADGQYHGEGKHRFYDGISDTKTSGNFIRGAIAQGKVEAYDANDALLSVYKGSFYTDGDLRSTKKRGKITYYKVYEEMDSDWSQNKVKSYDGDWRNDMPNGQGSIVYKNGKTARGFFVDGVYRSQ